MILRRKGKAPRRRRGPVRWRKRLLRWHADPAQAELFAAAAVGLERWRPFIPMRFRFVADAALADIVVSFGKVAGDGDRLAQAYRPEGRGDPREGNVIFDEAAFSRLSHEGRVEVLAHEFGHALGLGHSRRPSLMSPRFAGGQNAGMLWPLDIARIQRLYGRRRRNPDRNKNPDSDPSTP